MQWLEFKIDTTHEAAEVIVDYLSSLGADGVQVEDAAEILEMLQSPDSLAYADDGFIDSLDPVVHIKAYFARIDGKIRRNRDMSFTADDLYDDMPKIFVDLEQLEKDIRQRLSQISEFLEVGTGYLGWAEVREEDWAEGWKKYYETVHLNEKLVINPSWIDYKPKPHEIVISLDPGSAFGTGTHETTSMCAVLLEKYLIPDMSVLDLGCGSGILAIIAAKLGSSQVEAVDIDDLAVKVARENALINQVDLDCHQGELKSVHKGQYDLIVANIIADVIRELAGDFPTRMANGGLLITSGIIAEKAANVIEACKRAGLIMVDSMQLKDWCAYVWKRDSRN